MIGAFGKLFAKTKRLPPKFHRYLIDAAQTRTDADYSIERTVMEEEAVEAISQAEEFIQLSNQL